MHKYSKHKIGKMEMNNIIATPHTIISNTKSFIDANHCLNKIIGPHELIDTADQQPLDFKFNGAQYNAMIMGELTYGKSIIFKTNKMNNMHYYCITRPKCGTPIFKKGQQTFYATQNNAAIVSPNEKFEIILEQDCIQSFISISKPLLENTLSNIISKPILEPIYFENIMFGDNDKVSAWWNLVENFISSEHPYHFNPLFHEIRTDLEQILIKSLLLAQPHNYSHEIYKKYSEQDPEYFKIALDYIHHNICDPIDIDDLEKITGISRKILANIFKKKLNITLQSYIRYYRLQCIYNDLSKSNKDTNITSIALKWGISHLGRFSGEYKKLFGESPSNTIGKSKKI